MTIVRLRGIKQAKTKDLDMRHFKACEEALRKRVNRRLIPGYCSAVMWRGELAHGAAYGWADPERKLPYGPDVVMRLYCMTKPFVAVAVLILQERGLLHVNDPLTKHLPYFKHLRVAAHGNAVNKLSAEKPRIPTILEALTHTAGFGYFFDFGWKPTTGDSRSAAPLNQRVIRGEVDLAAWTEAYAKLPLRYKPGKLYNYGFGVDVVGRIIEVVTGKSLGAFLEEAVFAPLGMRDTAFYVPKSKAARLAAIYADPETGKQLGLKRLPKNPKALVRVDGNKPSESSWYEGRQCCVEAGGGMMGINMGGLVSTVNDSARFMSMLAQGGIFQGVRLLQTATLDRYANKDLFPEVVTDGKPQKNNGVKFGWSALGQAGIPLGPKDKKPDHADDYEPGEIGGGGAGCTYWAYNAGRETATVWFTQQISNDPYELEEENMFLAVRRSVPWTATGSVDVPAHMSKVPVRKTVWKKQRTSARAAAARRPSAARA